MNFKSNVYKYFDFDPKQTGDKQLLFTCKACVALNKKKTTFKGNRSI